MPRAELTRHIRAECWDEATRIEMGDPTWADTIVAAVVMRAGVSERVAREELKHYLARAGGARYVGRRVPTRRAVN